jgi:hypothetical protein
MIGHLVSCLRTMPHARLAAAVSFHVLIGCALAQRAVLTVGGPGAAHADLPAAVAAAAPGSILQVRPGTYTGFRTDKALRIVFELGASEAFVRAPANSPYAIEIHSLRFDQQFALVGEGVKIGAGTLGAVRVVDTSGAVVLTGIHVDAGRARSGLDVLNAANVIVQTGGVVGTPALQVQDGVLVAAGVQWSSRGGAGAVLLRATFENVLGGFIGHRQPALRAIDSTVRLAGDGATPLHVVGAPVVPVAAFEAIGGSVQWDQARFALRPANGAQPFVRVGAQLQTADVPALLTQGAPPGGVATLRLRRATPAIGFVLLGGLDTAHSLAGVPGIQLGPPPWTTLVVGLVDAAGLTRSLPILPIPALRGEVLCCQGAVLQQDATWLRTNPGTWPLL